MRLWCVGCILGALDVKKWKNFEVHEGAGIEELWEKVRFWSGLWTSVSEAFSCIMMDRTVAAL